MILALLKQLYFGCGYPARNYSLFFIHYSLFTKQNKVLRQWHPPQVEQSWVQSSEKSVVSGSSPSALC